MFELGTVDAHKKKKNKQSIIFPLNKSACESVLRSVCVTGRIDLASSIWLLCQSYFHSLLSARAVKLISNMPCVTIVLNLQLQSHNEESENVWTVHYPAGLSLRQCDLCC